ncbi:sugar kinase [Arsenicitalea aurantiaca]|uniref:Sugar kinase n=1 Tax=Arsenicitalea aurantiaca TaxID=1783274 RepID=A0A433XBE3_9HYPH|nr:sugar kinase [Arsenicitalea aurantiaca]RUT31374.1 sugar kinase [Arsenicitalea aurantiaca]
MPTEPIVTIGEILVEIMAETRGNGFREPQALIGPFPSGAPAIFIDQVAKAGHPAAIVSAVGDDDFGALNIDRLRADGVDVSAIAVLPGIATGSAFVRYREDGSRDFVFNIRHSASGQLSLTPEAERVLEGAGHLHVMGSALSIPATLGLTLDAVKSIKARGGTVSFDPNIRKEMLGDKQMGPALRAVLAVTDIFLPSGEELALFTGEDDEATGIGRLLQGGISEIVLKRGAAGASHFDAQGRTDMAGFAVEEIDPTGAGDCFGACYLVCRRLGMNVPDALRYANAAGARNVTIKGPMEGTSSLSELEAFIASTPQRS